MAKGERQGYGRSRKMGIKKSLDQTAGERPLRAIVERYSPQWVTPIICQFFWVGIY